MSEKQLVTARSFIKAFNASLLLRSDHHFENKSHQSDTQHQFLCLGTSLHSSCPATNMGRETWAAATTAAWLKSTGVRAKHGLIFATASACDLDHDDGLRVGSGDAEECFSFDPHPQAVTWADARE